MRLSELHTGEKGVIVKVMGRGAFRKRIIEMGFIRGKEVDVIQNAPLKDPIHYRVMGYDVSLRRNDAAMIEVISAAEYAKAQMSQQSEERSADSYILPSTEDLQALAIHKGKTINVALVGNPNCGKTSLFNFASGAHEHVGNYSGVTVDAKEGTFQQDGYTFRIVDLPGTYSLSAYTPEELYVRRHLSEEQPDVVINVLDASNLERNLYLTCQLIGLHYVIEYLFCNYLVAYNVLQPWLRLGHLALYRHHLFFGVVGKGRNLVVFLFTREVCAALELCNVDKESLGAFDILVTLLADTLEEAGIYILNNIFRIVHISAFADYEP